MKQRCFIVIVLFALCLSGGTNGVEEQDNQPRPSTRLLSLPESVHDKEASESSMMTQEAATEDSLTCEPSGPCINCSGSEKDSLVECRATGRKQAFRCFQTEGATESSDGPDVDAILSFRSCQRTEEDEEFRLLRFQLFCFMGAIASFWQVRKQKAISASLFDQRKQQAAVEMVETQSLVSNNSRDSADAV